MKKYVLAACACACLACLVAADWTVSSWVANRTSLNDNDIFLYQYSDGAAGEQDAYITVADMKESIGVNEKADKTNVLEIDNTTAFTPDADYEPATKKYVDDNDTDDQEIEEFFTDGQDLVISLEGGGTKRVTIPSTVITSVADYTIAEVDPLTYTCTGTTYYVSPDGDDAAAGTSTDTPWQTVGKVKSYSYSPGFSGGDCILFERGQTWTGEQLLIQGSGSTDSYITYGSYGAGDMPTLDGTGLSLSQYHGIIRASGQDWIRIDGLRVINAGFGDDLDNACIGFQNTNNTVVQNSEVYNCEGNGIKFNGGTYNDAFHNEVHHTNKGVSNREEAITITGATYSDIVANHVYSTGFSLVGGIGIDFKSGASYGVAHHNVLHDIPGANAMYADSFSTDMTDIEFYNNLVYNTDGPGLQIGSEKTGNLSNVKAHHNIFLNCAKGGFVMHDKSDVSGEETPGVVTGVEFYNNTLYGNGDTSGDQYGSIRIIDATLTTTGSVKIKNNIIYAPYNFAIGKFTSSAIPADAIVVDNNVISGNYTTATGGYTMLSNATTTSLQGAALDIGIIGTGSTAEDFFLDSDSPAKYAGDNSVVSGTASVVDYAGNEITDGTGTVTVTGGTVSVGALEYVEPTTTASSNVTDGTTDGQTVEWNDTSGKYEPVDQEYAEMGDDFDNDGGDGSTYATRKIFNMADALLAQYLKIADAGSQSELETLLGFSFAGGSVLSPNPQTGTTYTILTGDKGKTITGTNASAQVYTLLDEEGHWFDLINRGAGTLSLHAPTSSGVITLNGTSLDAGDEADFPANAFGRVIRTGSAAWSVDAFSGTLADGGAGAYSYSLTVDIVDGNATDKITYDSTDYTDDFSDTGLTADVTFTIVPDTGRTYTLSSMTNCTDNGDDTVTCDTDSYSVTPVVTFSDTVSGISDDFSSDTSADYTAIAGGINIHDGAAYFDTWTSLLYHEAATGSNDHYVQAKIPYGTSTSATPHIGVRCDGANGYVIAVKNSEVKLYYHTGSTLTQVDYWSVTGVTAGENHVTKLTVSGSTFNLYIDINDDGDFLDTNEDLGAKTDSTYSTGQYVTVGQTGTVDAFWVDDLEGASL